MQKTPIASPTAGQSNPHRWRLRRACWIGILAAGLVPVLWESAAICRSQWCEVIGRPWEAHTPILNAVCQHLESAHASIRESIEFHFRDFEWDVKIVLLVGSVVTVLAMMMLKR